MAMGGAALSAPISCSGDLSGRPSGHSDPVPPPPPPPLPLPPPLDSPSLPESASPLPPPSPADPPLTVTVGMAPQFRLPPAIGSPSVVRAANRSAGDAAAGAIAAASPTSARSTITFHLARVGPPPLPIAAASQTPTAAARPTPPPLPPPAVPPPLSPPLPPFHPLPDLSLPAALSAVQSDSAALESALAAGEESLLSTRSRMLDISRSNFIIERELLDIDEKIKLLIKNRLTIQEVMATSAIGGAPPGAAAAGGRAGADAAAGVLKNKRLYEEMFLLLQSKPRYLASLARLIQPRGDSIPLFVQTVVFDIFGDSFGSSEERLLLSLFRTALQSEMAACSDRATLLRGNSAITQMLSAYAKRGQGVGTLRDLLEQPLRHICESRELRHQNLELQPLKVHQQLITDYETETGKISPLDKNVSTDEDAARVAQVGSVLQQRAAALAQCCDLILDRILAGVDNIPYGMRWLCKTLGELYHARFREETPDAATLAAQIQSLQGGYIYLRFFNPVIVAPDAMNLIRDKPSRTLRRNLVLIAKVLQNLSNGVLFGSKEPYMQVGMHHAH